MYNTNVACSGDCLILRGKCGGYPRAGAPDIDWAGGHSRGKARQGRGGASLYDCCTPYALRPVQLTKELLEDLGVVFT